ncbi:MAG: glutamate--tRNA ligase family protein [Bdellovibrionota bacterium]
MTNSGNGKRFRWAPTPSGPLHLGNIFSFILTELFSKRAEGDILLRIDDLDVTRTRPDFVRGIFQVLRTLGLEWQAGPRDVEDFQTHFSQALFQDAYRTAFDTARLRFPERFFVCDCTRSEIARKSTDGLYPGTCRTKNLPWREGLVWRCRVPEDQKIFWEDQILGPVEVDLARDLGDFVIYRREGLFAYQWVSVCEDLRQGVTDVVRGEDLRTSTAAQIFLGEGTAFGSIHFAHHPLVHDGDKKLSKSEGARAVSTLLAKADGKRRILQACARWCGLENPQGIESIDDLNQAFYLRKGALNFGPTSQADEFF